MYAQRYSVTVTTAGDGTATAYTAMLTGRVITVRYVKDTFADGVGFTITAEGTGENIWTQSAVNASVTVAPRQATHTVAGAAALYASSGTAVLDHIVLAWDRVQIVIASGGSGTRGVFHVVIA